MHKEKNSMVNFAMQAGLALGGFWVFKYIFIIASSQYPALGYVNTFLSIMTPVILLFYLIKIKEVRRCTSSLSLVVLYFNFIPKE